VGESAPEFFVTGVGVSIDMHQANWPVGRYCTQYRQGDRVIAPDTQRHCPSGMDTVEELRDVCVTRFEIESDAYRNITQVGDTTESVGVHPSDMMDRSKGTPMSATSNSDGS
jgi:hypothetical protein